MSFSLHLTAVGFAWPAGGPLFDQIDLHLGPGWLGVVGPNGAGKSTLLELMAGARRPTAGRVRRDPAGLTVAVCPQRVDGLDEAIEHFAWDWTGEAVRLRAELDLDPAQIERWPSLSPGERKRWQLGAALVGRPGALLLDEPVNHLDADGRARLLAALRAYDGIGVIVAHDRALLDELTTGTLWVEPGRVTHIRAPYGVAARERAARIAGAWSALEARQAEARSAKARLVEARQRSTASAAARHRQTRDRRDRDARGAAAKDRAAHGASKGSQRLAGLRAAAESARAATRHDLKPSIGRALFVDHAPAPIDPLVALDAPQIRAGADGPVILRDVRLAVGRGDRVRITGANGAGKSTLIAALRAASRVPPARGLFVPQHLPAAAGVEALDAVRALPPADRGRVLQIVAALGVEPDRLLASARPSPGEARKLVLARGLARAPWWVVLDEPCNHLDLPSVERLQAALAGFPGALVLVSHDRAFAEATTAVEWRVQRGRVAVLSGPAADGA